MTTSYYSTGTITLVNGSKTVTGTGTLWLTSLIAGGNVLVEGPGNPLPIASVDSESQITAEQAWTGASGTYGYAIQRDTAYLKTLDRNSETVAYLLDEIRKGTIFKYDASGSLVDRAIYDARPKGFSYLVTEGSTAALYVKGSSTSGNWLGPYSYGSGPVGPPPTLSIGTVTTREPGQPATAGVSGSGGSYAVNLGIPSGLTGMTHRGAYDPGTAYAARDAIVQAGSTWIAKVATTGNAPPGLPTTENTWWRLVAAKGADGIGAGDMLKATFDPNNKQADAFNSANHVYNRATSGLVATTAQAAIDELVARDKMPTPTLDLVFTDRDTIDPTWFTRASSGKYWDAKGALRTAGLNEPRIDHDPATGEPRGLLIEEQRTNLYLSSGDLRTSGEGNPIDYWQYSGLPNPVASISPEKAPDGNGFYTRLTWNALDGGDRRGATTFPPGSTLTASVYFKRGNLPIAQFQLHLLGGVTVARSVSYDWNTKQLASDATRGWVEEISEDEIRLSLTLIDDGDGNFAYLLLSGNGLPAPGYNDVWGAQIEVGAFPTSYMPTTAAQVTRAMDFTVMPVGDWYNLKEGTLMIEGETFLPVPVAVPQLIADIGADGSFGDSVYIAAQDSGYLLLPGPQIVAPSASKSFRLAAGMRRNQFGFAANGSLGVEDRITGEMPVTPTKLRLGFTTWASTAILNGCIKRVTYWPQRLSNLQLQQLTA